MKHPQRGFAVVEAFIVIVVIAVIAFGGYWVWHNQNKKDVGSNLAKSQQEEVGPNGLTRDEQAGVEKSELVNINFQLYSYQTTATIYSRSVSNLYKPRAFLNGDDPNFKYDNPKYAHLVEAYKLNGNPLTINQYDSGLYEGKASTCAPLDPEFPDFEAQGYKCTQIGVTNLNTPIFAALSAVDQTYIFIHDHWFYDHSGRDLQ